MFVNCFLMFCFSCNTDHGVQYVHTNKVFVLFSTLSPGSSQYSTWQCGEQGWHSVSWEHSPSTNVAQTWRHKWAEFVGSLLCSERFFSGYSGIPVSSKTNIWFDLIWFVLIWFDLLWFKKEIVPSIWITSGISWIFYCGLQKYSMNHPCCHVEFFLYQV